MGAAVASENIDMTLARHEELPLSAILAAHPTLSLEAYSPDGKTWTVTVKGAEFKDRGDSGTLSTSYGRGTPHDAALMQLCELISGRWMVIDADGLRGGRQVFKLPAKVVLA